LQRQILWAQVKNYAVAQLYPKVYTPVMIQVLRSDAFSKWLGGLKDKQATARIAARIRSFELGNSGDCKPVRGGVWELRVHHGAGYRIYYTRHGQMTYFLLIGGVKSTQQKDIDTAVLMAKEIAKELKS
jgi:putative addiction module killer protein